ncbi:uncharacterized protein LOC110990655 [Acanthaster planci]|uniref:Uncharacterized protein LOC110990655 n=1 Tax=Acanthaster planci TaxID=133434 RepID=A0A8B8A233_ACAPL|nr:uncharacterized protein LOC110990655 [Acanthaster planci]
MQTNPVFTGGYPLAIATMGLVVMLLTMIERAEMQTYCTDMVCALWAILTAGDGKFLKPEASAMMWTAFHKFKLESSSDLMKLLNSLNIDSSGKFVHITYQYILQTVLSLMVNDRYSVDNPDETVNDKETPLSREEEQVLRYAAGYIPFALNQKLKRQSNETAAFLCSVLKKWRACKTDTEKTFLEYTNEWIEKQNRGGLFHVGDDVYIFFRTLEHVSRQFLTRANLSKFPGMNVKSSLKEKILSVRRVHNYWQTLTQGKLSGDVSKRFLDMVLNLWIKIRVTAFIKVYLDLKKSSGKVSKRGEKALRKTLQPSTFVE